jgi:hypothetical protein
MYVCTQLVSCSRKCVYVVRAPELSPGIEFGSHCLSLFVVSPAPSTQKENICVSDV